MAAAAASSDLVGREAVIDGLRRSIGRAAEGNAVSVLVSGEAGIGKTSLIRSAVATAAADGAVVAWGTCTDTASASGYWPWTVALGGLVRSLGAPHARELAGDDVGLLASIVPALGQRWDDTSERAQLLLMDAAARFLEAVSSRQPLVVVLDDLQWVDQSSLALLDFVTGMSLGRLAVVGSYRHDEVPDDVRPRLATLAARTRHVRVEGLDAVGVRELVTRITGEPCEVETAEAIHRRTGGHPFFVRELALLGGQPASGGEALPGVVRDAVERRIGRLPDQTRAALEVAAVAGTEVRPDVIARPLGVSTVDVDVALQPAVDSGVLVHSDAGLVFGHDLLREGILGGVELPRRIGMHNQIGAALEDRVARGSDVAPSELAHHFVASLPVGAAERAVEWSLRAAVADCGALAFKEAAVLLRRLRGAVANTAVAIDDAQLVDVLLAESNALARAGETVEARGLLMLARDLADRLGDAARRARVALATADLGARFAARRDEIVRELDSALESVAGMDPSWEARLAATLARELQHSVVEDRPRAGPLSERALALGRTTGDAPTLIACLLARHDVLWTPGAARERADVAREIAAVAAAGRDEDHRAEGLLLLANALLEQGSGAFEATLESAIAIFERLDQPRHRYTVATRRVCVALLRGRLDEAARLIESARLLGTRIREPDTDNVAMSQRLELVRAGQDADELQEFAEAAVAHWTGAPVHAHAVAAGFAARAGDLEASVRHVAAVSDLGTWRSERSYLWSVLIRELAFAARALGDRDLCAQLYEDLRPLGSSCGVNGAVVAFAGSHAHAAGNLAIALGRVDEARSLLLAAEDTYRRLEATTWLDEVRRDLADATDGSIATAANDASMRRHGPGWSIRFAGRQATVPHAKGLADIARLLASPAAEVHVLDLIDGADRSPTGGEVGDVVDRAALNAYRQRLADIDADEAEAVRDNDGERRASLEVERQALLDELRRATTNRGRSRAFANHPAERARKAVAGRVRDAIRKLAPVLPELAAHLERTIVTGTYCRYRSDDAIRWDVDVGEHPRN